MKKKLLAAFLTAAMSLTLLIPTPVTYATDSDVICCGDVTGSGSVTISDALEILKYLAKLDCGIENNPKSRIAATCASRGGTTDSPGGIENIDTAVPTVGDALEILKYLAKLDSYYSHLSETCDWCGGTNTAGTPTDTSEENTAEPISTTTSAVTTTSAITTTSAVTTTSAITIAEVTAENTNEPISTATSSIT
ncbi:MAG: hypothetical protein FWF82_05710, partial [Oscillospiraceae bacterium]|nr:hypothetical protein [Oscillospiraceae bacterium]